MLQCKGFFLNEIKFSYSITKITKIKKKHNSKFKTDEFNCITTVENTIRSTPSTLNNYPSMNPSKGAPSGAGSELWGRRGSLRIG
jgi:hypothetical protein